MTDILRVASYNLHGFRDDVDAVTRVIRAIAPDVLLLQEVPRRPLTSYRVSNLAARCGLYWAGRDRVSGGTTILTSLRVDLLAGAHHRLPVARLHLPRGYAVARVRRPGHLPVTAISLHLSLDARERVRHVRQVLDSGWFRAGEPLVVGGDLNETAGKPAWQLLGQHLQVVTPDLPTFRSSRPRHRIDAVFASPTLGVAQGAPVGVDPADLVAASDHRPVWADLVVPPAAAS